MPNRVIRRVAIVLLPSRERPRLFHLSLRETRLGQEQLLPANRLAITFRVCLIQRIRLDFAILMVPLARAISSQKVNHKWRTGWTKLVLSSSTTAVGTLLCRHGIMPLNPQTAIQHIFRNILTNF